MDERICKRFLALLALLMGLGGFTMALAGLAFADGAFATRTLAQGTDPAPLFWRADTGLAAIETASITRTLGRDLEPVVIVGAAVSALTGLPVDQLFVYAYTGDVWTQIPAQVDEVTVTGTYTTTEDSLLDANDEIVFMAKDLGDKAPAGTSITDALPVSADWYEIQVTDPISPAQKGWAYIVHSSTLTPTFTADYVSFDTSLHRVNGTSYSLGFTTTHPFLDYMALGGSGVDILDRNKSRLYCDYPIIFGCPITEDDLGPKSDGLIRDGPVRVILRDGNGLAYHSMVFWKISFTNIPLLAGDLRFSTDFSPAASGSTLYSAVISNGVTVDGVTDTVPLEPVSSWWQLSTVSGTVLQVADTTPVGGTQFNYYVDNSEVDSLDTGDQRHYGDTGILIVDPNLAFTYTFALYALPGSQPNVGATYEAYFERPLSATLMTLEAMPERLIVGQSSILTATMTDQHGTGISGTTVTFTLVSGSGAITPTTATTDAGGKATASLSSQVAGSVIVQVTADFVNSSAKAVIFQRGVYLPLVLRNAADSK